MACCAGTLAHIRMFAMQGEALEEVGGELLGPRDHHPARAVAAHPVGLGEPAEGQAEHVVAGRGGGVVVHGVVEEDLLVDLVGEDDELVAPGDVDEALDRLPGVDRAGGVVGVDDHQGVGVLGDLRLDVGEVGVPAVLLVAPVVHRGAAGQRDRTGPQRVVGRGHQDLVAVVDERLQHHRDQLGDAVADEDVVDADVAQAVLLVVVRDRRPGGVDALGVAVALRLGQVVHHVGDDRLGRLEAERRRVADVQLEDPVSLGLEPVRLDQDRAADVVADVLELPALSDRAHGASVAAARGPGAPCPRA